MFSTDTTNSFTWNGPLCGTCGARYLGSHTCANEDILKRVAELLALITRPNVPVDRMAGCPCRPENGGSGVCGCVLGGPQIVC